MQRRAERDKTAETSDCKQTRISSRPVSSSILRICLRGERGPPSGPLATLIDIVSTRTYNNFRVSRDSKSYNKSILSFDKILFTQSMRIIGIFFIDCRLYIVFIYIYIRSYWIYTFHEKIVDRIKIDINFFDIRRRSVRY